MHMLLQSPKIIFWFLYYLYLNLIFNEAKHISPGTKTIQPGCAKYNLGGNVVLHAAIEKMLLKQLFFYDKKYL